LAGLIGLSGLQLAEAKTKHKNTQPKPHHANAHKAKKIKKNNHH
jgi:hypothetical protein